jgi:hypothetical protein
MAVNAGSSPTCRRRPPMTDLSSARHRRDEKKGRRIARVKCGCRRLVARPGDGGRYQKRAFERHCVLRLDSNGSHVSHNRRRIGAALRKVPQRHARGSGSVGVASVSDVTARTSRSGVMRAILFNQLRPVASVGSSGRPDSDRSCGESVALDATEVYSTRCQLSAGY